MVPRTVRCRTAAYRTGRHAADRGGMGRVTCRGLIEVAEPLSGARAYLDGAAGSPAGLGPDDLGDMPASDGDPDDASVPDGAGPSMEAVAERAYLEGQADDA